MNRSGENVEATQESQMFISVEKERPVLFCVTLFSLVSHLPPLIPELCHVWCGHAQTGMAHFPFRNESEPPCSRGI